MTGGLEADTFIGSLAEEYRGLLNIRYPMEHGIVKDWNDMEKIWQHLYSKNQLNSNSEEVFELNSRNAKTFINLFKFKINIGI